MSAYVSASPSTLSSKSASERRILEQLAIAKRFTHNSLQVGVNTLQELDNQTELLEDADKNMNKQEELVDQSMRVLRGMTWSGSIYNAYSDASDFVTGSKKQQFRKEPEEEPVRYRAQYPTATNSSPFLNPVATTSDQQDAALDEIASAVSSLKSLGVAMGEKLQQQNEQLSGLESRAEIVHDKTVAVTVKSAKLNQSSSNRYAAEYIGTFQFMTADHTKMLATDGTNLVLASAADMSTLFRCFVRQNTLFGLQSEVTGKFVGVTMWGNLAVSGEYFGSQEECWIDLKGNVNGLLFIARNWGSGGWLASSSSIPTGDEVIVLNETTSSTSDRKGILEFKAIGANFADQLRPKALK